MSVVPDSIDPLIGWRHWSVSNNFLVSPQHLYAKWDPGRAFVFECGPSRRAQWTGAVTWTTWGGASLQNTHWHYAQAQAQGGTWAVIRGGGYTPEQLASGTTQFAHVPAFFGTPYPRVALPSGYGYTWALSPPPPPPANEPHTVPEKGCTCGIYATKTLAELHSQRSWPWLVCGRVALWGTVIAHERGYRAEKAYPLELFVYTPHRWVLPRPAYKKRELLKVAHKYNVGVRTFHDYEELCEYDSGADT